MSSGGKFEVFVCSLPLAAQSCGQIPSCSSSRGSQVPSGQEEGWGEHVEKEKEEVEEEEEELVLGEEAAQ